jgi:hypothetical protein
VGKVRFTEDYNGLKRGDVKDLPDNLARVLIARGIAVREKAVDNEAHVLLEHAKDRDAAK